MNTLRKRSRSISPSELIEFNSSSSSSLSTSSSISIQKKLIKTTTTTNTSLICSSKPLCHRINSTHRDLETLNNHILTCHTFICRLESISNHSGKGKEKSVFSDGNLIIECGRVFPTERYLSLHSKEVHNIAFHDVVEEDEKLYECLLDPELCSQRFSSPKKRRLHLIDKHQFPKEFYFDITLFGLQGIAKKGVGGGLIREVYTVSKDSGALAPGVETKEGPVEMDLYRDTPDTTSFARDVAPHLSLLDTITSSHALEVQANQSSTLDLEPDDSIMDELSNTLAQTKIKLDLVPRAVRLANKLKEKEKAIRDGS